ncbi:MAG TPA: hypothetical protein VFY35_02580 [Burkholderiaceae bacterium]|nr:hypothetical protein [Burkholderiaceae bacterium]
MDATTLQDALRIADAAASVGEAAQALRQRFASLRVMGVDALDMRDEQPAGLGQRRALFLGTSDGHCWHLTTDPTVATALLVADRT